MSEMGKEDPPGKGFKVDLHCHILPKRWPDLKEVWLSYDSRCFLNLLGVFPSVMGMAVGSSWCIIVRAKPK